MGYAILRVATRQHRAARAMLSHALRARPVPNAAGGGQPPQVLAGSASFNAASADLAKLITAAKDAGQRWRKDQVELLDVLVTASPQDMARWTKEQQDQYFADALNFLRKRWPAAKIITAAIHRDETTPHMQVLIAPTDERGFFRASKMLGNRNEMSALQDSFFEAVGRQRGLMRGEKRTGAKHVPIRKFYAALISADTSLPESIPVPPPPTLLEKLTGKAGEINAKRKKAIEHNKRVREQLLARASAAQHVHPAIVARAAEQYRKARQQYEYAKQIEQQANNAVSKAKKELEQINRAKQEIDNTVNVHFLLRVIDTFAAQRMNNNYRASLAKALNIELKPGKIIDQVRRALNIKTGAETIQAIDLAAQKHCMQKLSDAALSWWHYEHETDDADYSRDVQ